MPCNEILNFTPLPVSFYEPSAKKVAPKLLGHWLIRQTPEGPWLKLATEMDPHQVTVYVTAAYWLRVRLHKPDEAEKFLREGLRDNRDSPEILFELGTIYYQDRHDDLVSRNLWLEARKKWLAQKDTVKKTNELVFMPV